MQRECTDLTAIDSPVSPLETVTRPSRRFFPGWTMLGISAAAQYLSGPGQSYSVAAFKEPMRASLAISETEFSLAYCVATLISGISLPFAGRLIDRFGARKTLPVISALLGAACLIMSRTTDLSGLYLGFTMIRCLGQGALTLVAIWMVGEWFLRKRGFATALSGLGGSFSVMTFPLINSFVIAHYGWQTGWYLLGVFVVVALVPASLLLVRDRPEDLGLLPDGIEEPAERADTTGATSVAEPRNRHATDSWALREVLRDATFWKLLAVPASSGMIGTGMIFHQVSLLATRGVSTRFALGLISIQAAIASITVLGAGWLTDRWPLQRLLSIAMLMLAASVYVVLMMPAAWYALFYAALMGLHGSILRSAGTVVWINYYGRQHQGAIRGVAMSVMILAAAVGPLPLALARDRLENYTPALLLFIVVPLLASVLVATAKAPRTR